MVVCTGRMLSHNFRQQLLVDVASREICFKPAFRVLVFVVVCKAHRFLDLIVLVIADVYHDGRVVTKALHVVDGFLSHRVEDSGPGWVVATSEHEVLPDHDA